MSVRPARARIAALAVLAVSMAAGFGGAAEAAPYKQTCVGPLCFKQDTQGYTDDKTYFYMTFKGGTVTHYNLRYVEAGGRTVQYEVRTSGNSNKSKEVGLRGTPGKKYTVSVQACETKRVGGFLPFTKSNCTGWATFTYRAV